MTTPRTREETKAAGRDQAVESVRMVADSLREGVTSAYMDKAVGIIIEAAEEQARIYLRDGVPAKWVRDFRAEFLRTARAEFLALKRDSAEQENAPT